MNTDLYDALGVTADASLEAIKAAYRAKVKQHHPDTGGDPEAFRAAQTAYDVLSDPEKRARYDETGVSDTMDRAARIDAMARERFGAMLVESVKASDGQNFTRDWIAEALRQTAGDRARFEEERSQLKAKIAVADKLAGRFKPKTPRNVPKDVLSHVKREISRLLEQVEERLEVVARLEVLIKEYDFEADPVPTGSKAQMAADFLSAQQDVNAYLNSHHPFFRRGP